MLKKHKVAGGAMLVKWPPDQSTGLIRPVTPQ